MALKKELKDEIMQKYEQHKGDTGSPEVQVALLTKRINQLVDHLKTNKKDNHSRRGLLMLVGQRKKLLTYLKGQDSGRYKNLVVSLGLR
ncbi:MAG: 30S ribosomal protein S15 [Candidatus Saganbacteria bacterium]|nr:30S ribosomal protein S15 [Candidatus Saganbacteria bacterium]